MFLGGLDVTNPPISSRAPPRLVCFQIGAIQKNKMSAMGPSWNFVSEH